MVEAHHVPINAGVPGDFAVREQEEGKAMKDNWAAVAGEIGDDEVLAALFGGGRRRDGGGNARRLLARVFHRDQVMDWYEVPESDEYVKIDGDVMDWYEVPKEGEYVKINDDYAVEWTGTC